MGTDVALNEALTAFVRVRARYRRAMNLERDTGRAGALTGYLLTPVVRRALGRIVTGLEKGGVERAWALTGPYGSGKTAFVVFLSTLAHLMATPLRRNAQAILRESDPVLAQSARKAEFLPVVLTGERAPLDLLLIRALRNALEAQLPTKRGAKPAIFQEVTRLAERLDRARNLCAVSEVLTCFVRVAHYVGKTHHAGVLLIVDEAGKILEYAAENPARGDIQLFQALAEFAASSGDRPFVVVTVLHQAFDQYAARLSAGQRNEWAKVQGRFSDLIFQEEPDQLVKLIAAALDRPRPRPDIRGWPELVGRAAEWVGEGTRWDKKTIARHLENCWPLHPTTAVLLGPLFRGRLAQNERSLFAFLSSDEPLGFREFLKSASVESLFTPDRLYDYVVGTLGNRLFGQDGRYWAEIDTALRRLPPDAELVDAKIIKVSGMLSMLGDYVGLRPSAAILMHALADEEDVPKAVERLRASSVVVYRKFRDAYQIWEGSDLDVDQLAQDAVGQLPPDHSLAAYLMRLVPPRPLIARRHLFHTGTLRYFEVRFVDAEHLEEHHDAALVESLLKAGSDGVIFLVLPKSDDARRRLDERLADQAIFKTLPQEIPIVVGLPSSTAYLNDLARELEALERVLTATPALQTDVVARKELASRINEVHQLLEREVARVFAPDNPECRWFSEGGRLPVRSSRDLMGTLSDLFDLAYREAPAIRNELLNRRELSSAAAKARRNLLEAMIVSHDQPRLGFTGCPPEVSMYRSVLEEQGLHRQVGDTWRFLEPDGAMRGVWAAIERFLEDTERQRRPLTELYDRLKHPPFGIKEGPLPVLVCAALLSRESEVALYEQGSLVPELAPAVIEQLLRWPDHFEVRQSRLTGVRLEVFERLARSLVTGSKPARTVLDVVRGLLKFVTGLSRYARSTSAIAPETTRVREALLLAREPAQLLFQDLPAACGCVPFEGSAPVPREVVETFLSILRRSLGELQNAYPHLLARLEHTLSQALGLPTGGQRLRAELGNRAKRLLALAVESRLKGFVIRAMDDGLEHEEWLVSIATYLASKPPAEWVDTDSEQFQLQLALVSRKFRSLEAMAIAGAAPSDGATLVRVAVTQQGAIEQERVVSVRSDEQQMLALLRLRVMDAVESVSPEVSRETLIAALALVTEHLLIEAERESAPALEE